MDLKGIMLNEVSQTRKSTVCSHLYVQSETETETKNNKTNQSRIYREQIGGCQREGWVK